MSDLVSPYRLAKMGRFFDFMDRDKDGYLTVTDFFHNVKYLEETGSKRKELVRSFKRDMMSWWGVFQEAALENGRVSKADHVQRNAAYHADKSTGEDITKHYSLVFDMVDLDGNGRISFEELLLYYKAHDWKNENHVREVFRKLDQNGDGFVTRDEWVEAAIQFWLSDEPDTGFLY